MSTTGSEIAEALQNIADRISDDMSEKDVENAFLNENFYELLGYQGAGIDLRSELTLPDNRRPDYLTLDSNDAVTVVYEFKAPGRSLGKHTKQLFHYTEALKADYGVLTNGESFRWYKREGRERMDDLSMATATVSEGNDIYAALRKPDWDIRNPEHVREYLEKQDGVGLADELGQEHFFDTFRLEEGSPFANLVVALQDLLNELRDVQNYQFVTSAYNFWEATYAGEPDEIPESWEDFLDGDRSLNDFMFCLESGHAILARLLLAKATEDHDFFKGTGYNGMQDYFRGLHGFRSKINLEAYPVGVVNLIDDMRERLVEGLFQDDIFVWWTEAYEEQLIRGHDTGANQFRKIAQEESRVERIPKGTQERFSRAVAEVFFNVLRFDFSDAQGDLLGDLYQRYFDAETRQALGEFYTPQPVIDYIMDGVGYDRGVSNERLIDPACGSGTFLVEAVERYIEDVRYYDDDPDWVEHLQNLCAKPRIVGLDIHPFAVLMAQIRFVVALLPAYREAKFQDPEFTLSRLPIYRTDTLRNERELSGIEIGDDSVVQVTFDAMTENSQDVLIPVPLPIEVDEDEDVETEDGFLIRKVRMPLFDTIRLETGIGNFDEYFAALQGVIDTVKEHMGAADEWGQDFDWEYKTGLDHNIDRYTSQDYRGVEEFFEPYVNDLLEDVRYLREEHNDGRLFKMLEDSVLALVVKNYMEYDYVVGNPPYVRVQYMPDRQKSYFDELYDSAIGNYDLYCLFTERGIDWLNEGGRMGYIVPNQFMHTNYGAGMRREMLHNTMIEEMYDFRNSGVFEDAMNCPAVFILQQESDPDRREDNVVRCIRVKANIDDESGREVDEKIIAAVSEHRNDPGYEDNFIDVFDFPQLALDDGFWSLMPSDELSIFQKMKDNADATVGDITTAVFQGVRTSANKIYVVDVLDADRIDAGDKGDKVTIVPSGGSEEYLIETDLLRPFLQGRDIDRWRGNWSGQHVIFPYHVDTDEKGELRARLYSKDELQDQFPNAWKYFQSFEDELRGRERGAWEDSETWWEFGRSQNIEKFEQPKIIQPAISKGESAFMLDETGSWYFTTAYGTLLTEPHRNSSEQISCLLNSNALEFYFKHIAALKITGAYEYRTQFVEKLPITINWTTEQAEELGSRIKEIVDTIDLDSRTERFPEAYLGDFDGELEYINYTWNTRRYPVNAEIQGDINEQFTIQAGRSDSISDPAMHSSNREGRKSRANYVLNAVEGRNVKEGEETAIPIPREDGGVEQMLEWLDQDQHTIATTDIRGLESEIDRIVYDLFGIDEEEKDVVEEYLEVF